jgi:hypothetical protein
MGAPRTLPYVIDAFLDGGKGTYRLEDLVTSTGLTEKQVQAAMYTIRKEDRLPGLTVVAQARVWHYDPSGHPPAEHNGSQARLTPAQQDVEQWYERVGVTGSGKVIVKPQGDTALFVLTPLDI